MNSVDINLTLYFLSISKSGIYEPRNLYIYSQFLPKVEFCKGNYSPITTCRESNIYNLNSRAVFESQKSRNFFIALQDNIIKHQGKRLCFIFASHNSNTIVKILQYSHSTLIIRDIYQAI